MKSYVERDNWLDSFPGVRKKFLNQCVVCQEIGYDPEKIEAKEGRYFKVYIQKYWHALPVNDLGICEICERHAVGGHFNSAS